MYCIYCGKEVPPDAKYCMHCGKTVYQEKFETAGYSNSRTDSTYAYAYRQAHTAESPKGTPEDKRGAQSSGAYAYTYKRAEKTGARAAAEKESSSQSSGTYAYTYRKDQKADPIQETASQKRAGTVEPRQTQTSGTPRKTSVKKQSGVKKFFVKLWRIFLGIVLFSLIMAIMAVVCDKVDEKRAQERRERIEAMRPTKETLSPEEEALAARLPNVYKDYWTLSAFQQRGLGSSGYLKDDVVLTLILANDGESSWSQEEADAFLRDIYTDIDDLTNCAKQWGTELNVTVRTIHCTLEGPMQPAMAYRSLGYILAEAGYPSYQTGKYLREETGADSVPVAIAFNKNGRSYACPDSNEENVEACYLFSGGYAFKHELLHLFGAVDYYYHNLMTSFVKELMKESIMLESENDHVDDFTAYLVGWTDEMKSTSSMLAAGLEYIGNEALSEAQRENAYTGIGTITLDNGAVYSGYLSMGIPDGIGEIKFANGDFYTGEFDNGTRTGYGTYYWQNGDVYEGYFVNGQLHGKGTYTSVDGSQKSGTWNEGNFVG